ncbi:hypothetical protein B7463_g10669, partial [Scytalidium lignicola]
MKTDFDAQLEGERLDNSFSRSREDREANMDETRADLTQIATENRGIDSEDPALDPTSTSFDVEKWVRTVLYIADKANVKFRRASVAFKNLTVSGSGSAAHYQLTVASVLMAPFRLQEYFSFGKRPEKKILNSFDGVIKSGEMLLVLGAPGSGCSTFLKTIAGQLHGLEISKKSVVHYNGIPQKDMIRQHKGEVVYNSEVDTHFPHLTVRETLEFAATVRTPQNRVVAVSRKDNVKQTTAVAMSICGLSHTANTKRVSIAEMILASSSIGCWDNSTRGLDSATALDFVRALKMSANLLGTTHAVAIYQASQAIYDVFNKVMVLYEGREIFFGPTKAAKQYFEEMGWYCPARQTTGDFLTSVTNYKERKPRHGFENRVPRTPQDFQKYWRASKNYKALLEEITQHERDMSNNIAANQFRESRRAMQSRHLMRSSPYTVSIPMQIRACTKRAYQRLWNDKAATLTVVLGQAIMALVVGSVFFGTPNDTNSFFARGSTLFFAVLLNALIAITEINNLYQQRPIVEKHASYAFCHPFTEALAGIISDAPVKIVIAICFNIILYFLAGLRVEASNFFIFFLFTVIVRFTMSAMFRTVAAITKTISQALAIAAVLVLAIVIYTGYTIPRSYMKPWFKWLTYINPLSYAFEALMVNEFHGTEYPCNNLVPSYPNLTGETFICSISGAVAGQTTVSGDAYLETSFQYRYSHLWRNLGIMIGFWIFFLALYLGKGREEVKPQIRDVEQSVLLGVNADSVNADEDEIQPLEDRHMSQHEGVFTWRDIIYDIHIKDKPRRLLDHVSGWVKPGTLTALMGVSGAGKTTLLDVLAQRTSTGIISGDMFVNGKPLDSSFQRRTGYVQQQDVHLETSTVREALRFSTILRQSASIPIREKYDHVETVIEMLDMQSFSNAVVGTPGKGLNVEQRKLLSIGVELAAKPALLIFLDEPTSGLDSQSSWAIVTLLRKLADSGQAILATIHQPSSILFLQFDRLLFLAKGGKTVYFGDIGPNATCLLNYFERNGARSCSESENPAEYILEAVTAGSKNKSGQDWPYIWNSSDEFMHMKAEQEHIYQMASNIGVGTPNDNSHREFATPLSTQILYTTIRVFQQYWRTPSYIWGKLLLGLVSALVQSSESQGLIMLFCIQIFMFASTFAHMIIAVLPDSQTAGAVATLMFSMTMIFNGVFQPPQALPGFWIFMYRVSPLTYIVSGIAATGLQDRPVKCSASETSVFNPENGLTCGSYLQAYLRNAPGQLYNPTATTECQYCQLSNSEQFLALSNISLSTRWRNFGIVWAYIVFNICMAITLYYVFRVRKWGGRKPPKILIQVKNCICLIGRYVKLMLTTWWGQTPSS